MTSRTKWARGARSGVFRSVVWSIGVLAAATSCGGGDEAERAAQAAERAADAAELAAEAAQAAASAVQEIALAARPSPLTPGVPSGEGSGSGSTPTPIATEGPGAGPVVQPPPTTPATVCVAPPGVSTTPSTIPEVLGLLNSLPKPTTLECLLQAMTRPLALYMTSSTQSLQPATGGERSPRTFVLRGALELSIVLDGPAMATLEIAYRTTPERSIKTEILFPITRDVTPERFFDRVLVGTESTECGNCHVAEAKEEFEGFPDGVFNSDVIPPYDIFEVSLDRLRTEHETCNAQSEPGRCALLSALLDHGDVQSGQLGNPGL